MYLSDLVKKNKAELNAMKKEEIITCIVGYGFQYTSAVKEAADAKKELDLSRQPNERLIIMLMGFLGIEPEFDGYSKKPDLSGYTVEHLVGQVIAKAIVERKQ